LEQETQFIPDYSKYSLGELEDIYSRMQKDRFPDRLNALENEIKKKKIELGNNPTLENLEKSNYHYEYAGFWKRAAAVIIDTIIALLMFPVSNYLLVFSFSKRNVLPILLYDLILMAFMQYFCIIKFGGTPGHLIMQIRTINNSGKYLDFNKAFLRSLTYLPVLVFTFFQINNAIITVPPDIQIKSFIEIALIIRQYGGIFTALASMSSYITFFDIGTVLFNDKNRAIHDFIAGSYVVTLKIIEENEKVKSNLIDIL
jgi:uncharacterized RDD family membrane protein YckC